MRTATEHTALGRAAGRALYALRAQCCMRRLPAFSASRSSLACFLQEPHPAAPFASCSIPARAVQLDAGK
jgi:hypothetical protein